ncbi:ABC transporter permease [Cytobacillus sp. Hm23]|uniref:ABC transporter permease n=1 Tax=Cytobacillus sp. IB215665 TaxID=3097357 RepID=UPI002A0F9233|nr:ABC transporter permease [Cytobacillus sp. IB215665]MDX8364539.1 ABC transporter permease [Cytobacillus sp. IB215665]
MLAYIVRRLFMTIPLLLGITIISFVIIQMAPGDPTALLIDPSISPADKEKMIENYGLNDPIHVQYLKWVGNMLQGDFGTSLLKKGTPVSEMIMNRLPNTLLLMLVATVLAFLISIPLGVYSATRPYSKLDYGITVTSFLGLATPNFWLGLILIMFFSVKLGWFPTGGVANLTGPSGLWDRIHHLILPAFVLASADMASLTRYTRSSMIDVTKQDYMRTARAKGLKRGTVIYKHGLRNGLTPVITIFGVMLPTFIGGSVIVEQVFAWPGLGRLFFESAFKRDYPVIMALTVLSAVLVIIGNMIADILYAVFDPRIEYK